LAGEYNRLYMDRVPVRVLPIFFFRLSWLLT
jgi:hypothetical protein